MTAPIASPPSARSGPALTFPRKRGKETLSLRCAKCGKGWGGSGNATVLQHRETPVLAKGPIEGNRLVDLKPLHDDKAQRVAKRIRLIVMTSNQLDSSVFVASENSLNSVCVAHYNI